MNEGRLSDMNTTMDHGSSYASVLDIRRENTFGKDTDGDTRDICTFCMNIENKTNDADYFCQDCGPFGRFLCAQCLKYHKRFKKEHVSVKSFAVANYDNRHDLPLDEEKMKNTVVITGVSSPEEVIRESPAGNEEMHMVAKGLNSDILKGKLKDKLQIELMKTEKEAEVLRKQLTKELADVQESMAANEDGTTENKEIDTWNEFVLPRFLEEQITRKQEPEISIMSEQFEYLSCIAKQYENLYQNQWDDAYDIVQEHFAEQGEKWKIQLLLQILQEVNKMCKKEHEKQDKELMKAFCRAEKPDKEFSSQNKRFLQTLKLSFASDGTDSLTERFINRFDESSDMGKFIRDVEEYLYECFAVCWLIALHGSQVNLYSNVRHLQAFNGNLFKSFDACEEKIEYIVWPALVVNSDRAKHVLAKGVVKCEKRKPRFGSKTARVRSEITHKDVRGVTKSARISSTKNPPKIQDIDFLVRSLKLHDHKRKKKRRNFKLKTQSGSDWTPLKYHKDSSQNLLNLQNLDESTSKVSQERKEFCKNNIISSNIYVQNFDENQETCDEKQKLRLPSIKTETSQRYPDL